MVVVVGMMIIMIAALLYWVPTKCQISFHIIIYYCKYILFAILIIQEKGNILQIRKLKVLQDLTSSLGRVQSLNMLFPGMLS